MSEEEVKFYNKKWFTVLMLVFFAPLGIFFMWKNKFFEKKARKILTVVFMVWFVIVVVVGQPTEEEKAEEQAKQEQIEKEREEENKAKEEKKKQEELEKEKAAEFKKEQDEAVAKAQKEARDGWQDYRKDLLEHYGEAQVLDIRTDDSFIVFYAYVPNEFKMSSEGEKQYYVEEIGPLIEADLNSHFNDSVHVYFRYEDNVPMADRKAFGGWKIK